MDTTDIQVSGRQQLPEPTASRESGHLSKNITPGNVGGSFLTCCLGKTCCNGWPSRCNENFVNEGRMFLNVYWNSVEKLEDVVWKFENEQGKDLNVRTKFGKLWNFGWKQSKRSCWRLIKWNSFESERDNDNSEYICLKRRQFIVKEDEEVEILVFTLKVLWTE